MIHPAIGASPISLIMNPITDPAATTTKTWAIIAKQVTLQTLLAKVQTPITFKDKTYKTTIQDLQVKLI